MEKSTRVMPRSDDLPLKLSNLAKAKDYTYTSDDIEKLLAEKKKVMKCKVR